MSLLAYGASFTGGARVAAADVDGDDRADVITAAGPGGGPHVKALSGADSSTLSSFFAGTPTVGAAFVAAGR